MGKTEERDSGEELLAASFGRCVTKHREAANLTMARLAAMAGMSRAYMWRVEEGLVLPSLRNVARISVALAVPVSRLLEGWDTSAVELSNRPYERDGEDGE